MLQKILNKIRFKFFLYKKAFFQNNLANQEEGYLIKDEKKLKEALDISFIDKKDIRSSFHKLSDLIYQNFSSSGVSYKDFCDVIAGKLVYNRSGNTPEIVQQVLVDNYCKTNGLFQEVLFDFLYRDYNRDYILKTNSPIFGSFNRKNIEEFSSELKEKGYCKLPFSLPLAKVQEIVSWSKSLEYRIIDDSLNGDFLKSKIDFSNPKYVKASAMEHDLKNNANIMEVCNDPVILSILQNTLGAELNIWHLSMWWSFQSEKPSSEAAQYFHYDLDTLRWLKVFIYLTDVDIENGPHTALTGSHNIGMKNYNLLKKRYSRISDDEINAKQFGKITEFCAPAGTIIIGDTRCWHKGKEVLKGNRLILQPTYSPTYFLKNLVD